MRRLVQHINAAHMRVADNPSLDEDEEVHQAVLAWLTEERAGVEGTPPHLNCLNALYARAKETG